jgi:hypothetical protein
MTKARDLASASIVPAAVSVTELGYIDGVTSAIQTQINAKAATAATINPTIVDAKGDLIAATAADAVSRLAVGANDTVLTADSTAATGVKWAAVAAGPVQLATVSLAGISTTTFSSITGIYKTLFLRAENAYDAGPGASFNIRINGSSAANYNITRLSTFSSTSQNSTLQAQWQVPRNGVNASGTSGFEIYFPSYTKTNTAKTFYGFAIDTLQTRMDWVVAVNTLSTITTAAITSIEIFLTGTTWTAGDVTLFGVN